jgi:hypothetical protein
MIEVIQNIGQDQRSDNEEAHRPVPSALCAGVTLSKRYPRVQALWKRHEHAQCEGARSHSVLMDHSGSGLGHQPQCETLQ